MKTSCVLLSLLLAACGSASTTNKSAAGNQQANVAEAEPETEAEAEPTDETGPASPDSLASSAGAFESTSFSNPDSNGVAPYDSSLNAAEQRQASQELQAPTADQS